MRFTLFRTHAGPPLPPMEDPRSSRQLQRLAPLLFLAVLLLAVAVQFQNRLVRTQLLQQQLQQTTVTGQLATEGLAEGPHKLRAVLEQPEGTEAASAEVTFTVTSGPVAAPTACAKIQLGNAAERGGAEHRVAHVRIRLRDVGTKEVRVEGDIESGEDGTLQLPAEVAAALGAGVELLVKPEGYIAELIANAAQLREGCPAVAEAFQAGDADGDGDVDRQDLQLAIHSFGRTPEHAGMLAIMGRRPVKLVDLVRFIQAINNPQVNRDPD